MALKYTLKLRATQQPLRSNPLPFLIIRRMLSSATSSTTTITSPVQKHENALYEEALKKLALLHSNRQITQSFDQPQDPAAAAKRNELAIPEMKAWLLHAGYTPEDIAMEMTHIHVAGSKGKGSICAYATSLLMRVRGSSARVGTYTSPHLVSPRERIAINGVPVSKKIFAVAFFEIWSRFTEAAKQGGWPADVAEGPASKPFYFRFMTILAWHIFMKNNVRDVVIECGIGGEYDATNVLTADGVSVAVVGQLGIDHVNMLGDTVEKIAWHKAGIFKRGRKAYTRHLKDQPEVMQVLRARAEEKGATLIELTDEEIAAWGGVKSSLRGDFQVQNQALAAMAVRSHIPTWRPWTEKLNHEDFPENIDVALRKAMEKTTLRARGEVLKDGEMKWYLDGAHNHDSLKGVAAWLSEDLQDQESIVLVFNQQERDASQLLSDFIQHVKQAVGRDNVFSHAIFTTNDAATEGESEEQDTSVQEKTAATMRKLCPDCEAIVVRNTTEAVAEARRLSKDEWKHKVLATGSMHLMGGLLRVLQPGQSL